MIILALVALALASGAAIGRLWALLIPLAVVLAGVGTTIVGGRTGEVSEETQIAVTFGGALGLLAGIIGIGLHRAVRAPPK